MKAVDLLGLWKDEREGCLFRIVSADCMIEDNWYRAFVEMIDGADYRKLGYASKVMPTGNIYMYVRGYFTNPMAKVIDVEIDKYRTWRRGR